MYKCLKCGRIITDEEYAEELEHSGSGGYCLCEFTDGNRILHEMVLVKWWEMLDWNQMEKAWDGLSEKIKNDIRSEGLAPDYDLRSSDKTGEET